MKNLLITFAFAIITFTGCKVNVLEPDLTPPSAPTGIATYPGDGLVEVDWTPNPEYDVDGYNVYASQTLNGKYELIGSTRSTTFLDKGIHNGEKWYYTVSAYDNAGNESDLSREALWETARPEGNASIANYLTSPSVAGYDFSTYSVGPYDDQYTDMYFEYYDGTYYMDVWTDTDIQDLGYTNSLYSVEDMPTKGWSTSKDVILTPGHTYAVWTWNNHYAKFRVTSLTGNRVKIEWAYQLIEGNNRLKSGTAHRGALKQGSGFTTRHALTAS